MSGVPYNRACFVANLRELGMSQGAFAERFGLNSTTVYHWGTSNLQPFPSWVPVLMAAWLDNRRLRESSHGL